MGLCWQTEVYSSCTDTGKVDPLRSSCNTDYIFSSTAPPSHILCVFLGVNNPSVCQDNHLCLIELQQRGWIMLNALEKSKSNKILTMLPAFSTWECFLGCLAFSTPGEKTDSTVPWGFSVLLYQSWLFQILFWTGLLETIQNILTALCLRQSATYCTFNLKMIEIMKPFFFGTLQHSQKIVKKNLCC